MAKQYKLQVEMTDTQLASLEDLQSAGDLKTKKDLIDNAFTLLKWAVKQKQEGSLIISMNPQTNAMKELVLPYLQTAEEKGIPGSKHQVRPYETLEEARDALT